MIDMGDNTEISNVVHNSQMIKLKYTQRIRILKGKATPITVDKVTKRMKLVILEDKKMQFFISFILLNYRLSFYKFICVKII